MSDQIIEIEADTLKEARERVKSQIPDGLHLLSERVITDGMPKTVKGVAVTTEAAFAKAQGEIPADAVILERKELTLPSQELKIVEAFDEYSARTQLERQIRNTATIMSLKLVMSGNKGFLGFGKKPNRYEAEIYHQAVVEITYKTKAKISVKIGEKEEQYDSDIAKDTYSEDSGDTCPYCGSTDIGRAPHGEAYYAAQCRQCGRIWSDYA